MVVNVGKQL